MHPMLPAFSEAAAPRNLATLDESIIKLETEHDTLNLEFSKGEVSGFNAAWDPHVKLNCSSQ